MKLNLSNKNKTGVIDNIMNPKTGTHSYIFILFIVLLICIATYVLLRNNKYAKFMILIFGAVIIIPISAYALCRCDINIESNVKIDRNEYYVYGYFGMQDYTKIGTTIGNEYTTYDSYKKLVDETGHNLFIRLKMESSPRWCINDSQFGSMCDDSNYGFINREDCINDIKDAEAEDRAFCELKRIKLIKDSYLGFIYNNKDFYIHIGKGTYFKENREVLIEAFGEENVSPELAELENGALYAQSSDNMIDVAYYTYTWGAHILDRKDNFYCEGALNFACHDQY